MAVLQPVETITSFVWRDEPESGGRTRMVARLLRFAGPVRPTRLALPVRPYHVHHLTADNAPLDLEVVALIGGAWRSLGRHRSERSPGASLELPLASPEPIAWTMVLLRRAEHRRWWPVAETLDGLELRGETGPADATAVPVPRALDQATPANDDAARMRLVDGWCVQARGALLATSTRFLLRVDPTRAALESLAIDMGGDGRYGHNLLVAGACAPSYQEAGRPAPAPIAGLVTATLRADGAYALREFEPLPGVTVRIAFHFRRDGFALEIARHSRRRWLAARLADLSLRLDSSIAIPSVLALPLERGASGRCAYPVCAQIPGLGTLEIDGRRDGASWVRCDHSFWGGQRLELCVGDDGDEHGLHVVEPGERVARFEFSVHPSPAPVVEGDEVERRAFAVGYPTALGYRPDWGLFTNNGASCPVDFATHGVAELALRAPPLSRDGTLDPTRLLGGSLDILLRGGGWYGAGVEDRFIAAHPSVLWACVAYLARTRDRGFLERHRARIAARMRALFALDRDGDGIFESAYPGCGDQPGGSAWFDQLRAGHQDAFSNPIACRALDLLVGMWRWAGDEATAAECAERARRLRTAFLPAFRAPSGRIAGWRDARGQLHDHAFVAPTTLAVAYGVIVGDEARALMERLWRELRESGFTRLACGLPLSLRPVARADYNPRGLGHPLRDDGADTFGAFLNGGVSPAWAGEAVEALHRVGMHAERDELIDGLLAGYADGRHAGGLHSRRDWFAWDGTPTGYEGLLCDGFVPLATILRLRQGAAETGFSPA